MLQCLDLLSHNNTFRYRSDTSFLGRIDRDVFMSPLYAGELGQKDALQPCQRPYLLNGSMRHVGGAPYAVFK